MKSYKSRRALMTIVLSLIMILGAATSAFASTITIDKSSKAGNEGAEYTYYQVLKATGTNSDALTVEPTDEFAGFFGDDYKIADGAIQEKQEDGSYVEVTTDGYAKKNDTKASGLAAALQKYVLDNSIVGTTLASQKASADLEEGYYLVRETSTPDGGAITSNPILVNLSGGDKTITPKDDRVTLEKKIVEEDGSLKDINTAKIGDDIDYQVVSNIPVYEASVFEEEDGVQKELIKDSLTFEFTDTFDEGLTYNEDLKVYVESETDPIKVTITKSGSDGFVAGLTPDQIRQYAGQTIKLVYSAKLNDKAKVNDEAGNKNDVKLKYTNNPNMDGEAKYDTLDDQVKTYTFGFEIRKVDANNNNTDLAGAEWKIKDSEGNVIATVKYDDKGQPVVAKSEDFEDITVEVNEKGYVVVDGIKAGDYKIEETKAPEGYSLVGEDVNVHVNATVKKNAETGESILDEAGNEIYESSEATITADGGNNPDVDFVNNGDGTFDFVVKIKDYKGISLPETGRNTALYCMIGGGALVVLGGLYYAISRRRNNA